MEPEPSKITSKMEPKEINRVHKKVTDFERRIWSKNARKSGLEIIVLET